MRYAELSRTQTRTHALVFEEGDEVLRDLGAFLAAERILSGSFTAIGGFREATLAYFDWTEKQYKRIAVDDQVEVVSLIGNVAFLNAQPVIHSHAVVSHSDGHTTGGHLMAGHVRPTIELFFQEVPAQLHKVHRPEINLALVDIARTTLDE